MSGQAATGRPVREISLQAALLRLVLLSVAPLVLVSAGLIYHLVSDQRASVGDEVQAGAIALAGAIDAQLSIRRAVIETFAETSFDNEPDLPALHEHARRLCAGRPGTRIALIDARGTRLFDTALPLDAPRTNLFVAHRPVAADDLPPDDPEELRDVFETGRPSFSNLFSGDDGSGGRLALRHPVRRGDTVTHVITMTFPAAELTRLLQREYPPDSGIATIIDRRGVIAARNLMPGKFVGKLATTAFLVESGARRSGVFRGNSLEGLPVITAFHRSEPSGWRIATAQPLGAAEQGLNRSLWIWSSIVAVLVTLAVSMARRTWSQVGRPLRVLAANARAFERGEPIVLPDSPVREVRTCGRAWALAIEADRARREQQRLKLAAELRQREAEQASREKDRVLAALGHELRNPLGAISNSAHVMETVAPEDPRLVAMIGIIRRQCRHLGRLVDNLLDLARATFGKMQVERVPLDMMKLARQTVSTYSAHGVGLPRLTVSGEPGWVAGDSTRLEQVLRNLIDNAIKFTPPAGSVDVSVANEGDEVIVSISDTGAGILPEVASSLFTAFVQNEQTLDRSQGGLGLGLALVREIVELHGGSVSAHSDGADRGTRVTIRLPRCQPADGSDTRPDLPADRRRRRILIVEDQEDVRTSLRFMLESMGQECRAAMDAAEAREAMKEWLPDAALIDLGLPGTDGFALATELRADPRFRSVRLVAVTGYTQPVDRQHAADAGFDDFLAKPVSHDVLARTLQGTGPARRDTGPIPGR